MNDPQRKLRAAQRRQTAILNRGSLQSIEEELTPISGLAAISLLHQLAREAWALSGKDDPAYERSETPVKFVPASHA